MNHLPMVQRLLVVYLQLARHKMPLGQMFWRIVWKNRVRGIGKQVSLSHSSHATKSSDSLLISETERIQAKQKKRRLQDLSRQDKPSGDSSD
jgi:hypothetical protein